MIMSGNEFISVFHPKTNETQKMSDNDTFEDATAEPTPSTPAAHEAAAPAAPAAPAGKKKAAAKPAETEKKPRAGKAAKAANVAAAAAAAEANENATPTKPKAKPRSKPSAPVAPVPEEKAVVAAAQPDAPATARAHRWHPGTVARREIHKLQQKADIVMRHAPFERRMRYLMERYATPNQNTHFSADAIRLLEEAYQDDCVSIFQDLVQNSCHGDRATVMEKDLTLWKHYMNKYTNTRTYIAPIPSDAPLAIAQ